MKSLLLLLAVALSLCLPARSQVTNVLTIGTNTIQTVTFTVTNHVVPAEVTEFQVPLVLSSLRFVVTNEYVMGADISKDRLLLDVPGSSRKLWSYSLDSNAWYVVETRVTVEGGILQTKRQAPITGVTDLSPSLPRNRFTGEYDTYLLFLVPPPL